VYIVTDGVSVGVHVKIASLAYPVVVFAAVGTMIEPVQAEQSAHEAELIAPSDAWIEAEVRSDAEALARLLTSGSWSPLPLAEHWTAPNSLNGFARRS
jgi:hypothetical protein